MINWAWQVCDGLWPCFARNVGNLTKPYYVAESYMTFSEGLFGYPQSTLFSTHLHYAGASCMGLVTCLIQTSAKPRSLILKIQLNAKPTLKAPEALHLRPLNLSISKRLIRLLCVGGTLIPW